MFFLFALGLLADLVSNPPLPASGRILKGDLRVYRSPVVTRDEAGTIRGRGRYAILERGPRCDEGWWWKITPRYWVCSGWFLPGNDPPGDLEDWSAATPQTGWYRGLGTYSFIAPSPAALTGGRTRRLRMLRGFLPVQEETFHSRRLLRLVSGQYIDASTVERYPDTSLRSVAVDLADLPGGFVIRSDARLWRRTGPQEWEPRQKAARYSFWFLSAPIQERVRLRKHYQFTLLRDDLRIAPVPPPPPPEIRDENEPWADVDLSNQVLYAFRGAKLVRLFLVSAARETPTGMHRVYWKVTHAVFDRQKDRNTYYLEAVPFVLYFKDAYALHGAYWHDEFGTTETHGCVNLSPADARWLFDFLAPQLPAGFASIRSDALSPGSWIRLRR